MFSSLKKKFTPGQDRVFYCQGVYGQEEINATVSCLQKGWLGLGLYTEKFEKKVARVFGKKYGLFVNSGCFWSCSTK